HIDTNLDIVSPTSNPDTDNTAHHDQSTPSPVDSPVPSSPPVLTHAPKPNRIKHMPSYMSDYVCNSSDSSAQASSTGTFYPISSFHYFAQLSSSHRVFTMSLTQDTEPKTYTEACKSEHWIQAMNSELEALARTGTWKIIDLPPNVKPIGSKWVYKIKHKSDGSIERYK
ncbi:retrovirus-related pol polyprotein from transposon TNT 1-94, partial [Trifolium medium]|nr:retrovirus-related pol polyprotein from transposon TNT 1-94 [Trifolium medium]